MFRKSVFIMACLLPVLAFATEKGSVQDEKTYVHLDELVFDRDGIWLKNPRGSVLEGTEALRFDSRGYYVSHSEKTWKCAKCGHTNKGAYPGWGCRNCAFPFD